MTPREKHHFDKYLFGGTKNIEILGTLVLSFALSCMRLGV